MQTFLPYPNFKKSAKTLDWRRLGKQRVEAYQILKSLSEKRTKGGWVNHPAVKMWRGYENALSLYMNECIDEWKLRGYKNTMEKAIIRGMIIYPKWLGDNGFHAAHRSNLLRKDFEYYSKFGWKESTCIPYKWPV